MLISSFSSVRDYNILTEKKEVLIITKLT